MNAPRILIAGIGNVFLNDDGFGVEVAQRLATRSLPAGVRVADFGIRGLDLAFALCEGCSAAILIDAAPRGGEPGTIYIMQLVPPAADPGGAVAAELDAHGMDPLRVLRLAASLGSIPDTLYLVGCEPERLVPCENGTLQVGLSPRVSAAVEEAAAAVERLVQRIITQAPGVRPAPTTTPLPIEPPCTNSR